MKRFAVSFIGRRAGAIGLSYRIHTEVEVASIDDIRLKLYDHWEHIEDLRVEEITS